MERKIIAATNKDLLNLVKKGEFWEINEMNNKSEKIIVSVYEGMRDAAQKYKVD